MKTMKSFKYVSVETASEASSVLIEYRDRAKLLAGGTDLLVMMKDRVIAPEYVIDIKSIPGLDRIEPDVEGGIRIGALTRIANIVKSALIRERYPALQEAAESLGSVQVRNMATIGGNICRSSPSADTLPPLLVYGARLKLIRSGGERIVPLRDFLTGPGKNILDDEVLAEILLPPTGSACGSAFIKLSRVSEDLAKVNCAAKIAVSADGRCEEARIVLGAVAETPVRAASVEQALIGRELSEDVIKQAALLVGEDISPIDDVRSTARYRIRVSRVLIARVLKKAIHRCGRGGG
jgi:carbon-monoxide dehydrogenase medium subunit